MVWIITKFTRPTRIAPEFDSETLWSTSWSAFFIINFGSLVEIWASDYSLWYKLRSDVDTLKERTRYVTHITRRLRLVYFAWGNLWVVSLRWRVPFLWCLHDYKPIVFPETFWVWFQSFELPDKGNHARTPYRSHTPLVLRTWNPLHSGKIMSFEKRFWRPEVITLHGFSMKYTVISVHYIWNIAPPIS